MNDLEKLEKEMQQHTNRLRQWALIGVVLLVGVYCLASLVHLGLAYYDVHIRAIELMCTS